MADDILVNYDSEVMFDHRLRKLIPLDEGCCVCGKQAYYRCGWRRRRECCCFSFVGCDKAYCKDHIYIMNKEDTCLCLECKKDFEKYEKKKKCSWALTVFIYFILTILLPYLIYFTTQMGYKDAHLIQGSHIPYKIKYAVHIKPVIKPLSSYSSRPYNYKKRLDANGKVLQDAPPGWKYYWSYYKNEV